jgi:hypothetical protein
MDRTENTVPLMLFMGCCLITGLHATVSLNNQLKSPCEHNTPAVIPPLLQCAPLYSPVVQPSVCRNGGSDNQITSLVTSAKGWTTQHGGAGTEYYN